MPDYKAKIGPSQSYISKLYEKVAKEYPNVQHVNVAEQPKPNNDTYAYTNLTNKNIFYNPGTMAQIDPMRQEGVMAHEIEHVRQLQNETPWETFKDRASQLLNNITGSGVPKGYTGTRLNDPYYWDPHELQAFQADKDRATRLHYSVPDPMTGATDISLPSGRKRLKYSNQLRGK